MIDIFLCVNKKDKKIVHRTYDSVELNIIYSLSIAHKHESKILYVVGNDSGVNDIRVRLVVINANILRSIGLKKIIYKAIIFLIVFFIETYNPTDAR